MLMTTLTAWTLVAFNAILVLWLLVMLIGVVFLVVMKR